MSGSLKNKKRSLFKKIVRIAVFILVGMLIITLIGILAFYFNKDKIAQQLIVRMNEMQNGKILVEDISLSPFKHFPNISVRLDKASFSEKNNKNSDNPFIEIDRLYVSLDVLKLIDGDVSVSKVTLDGGYVHLRINEEGSFNLLRAASTKNTDSPQLSDSSIQNEGNLTLNLSGIEINGVNFSIIDDPSGFSIDLLIRDLSADLTHAQNQMDIDADMDFNLQSLGINNHLFLKNKDFTLVTGFRFDVDKQMLQVTNGLLNHKKLSFGLDGNYDLENSIIDLKVDGSDNGLDLLSLVIEEDLISMNKNLVDQGELYFNGTIRGNTSEGIPNSNFNFGAQDIKLHLPNGQKTVKAFSFKGMFASGTKSDLSLATLQINELNANFAEGGLTGSFEIMNFAKPAIILEAEGSLNLKNFHEIFTINGIDSLAGKLKMNLDINTVLDTKSNLLPTNHGEIFIGLEDVAIKLAHFEPLIHELNGNLLNTDSIVNIENISFLLDSSDIQMSGRISNLISYVLNYSESNAALEISSKRVNLNDLALEENQIVSNLSSSIAFDILKSEDGDLFNIEINQLKASPDGYPEIKSLTGSINYRERSNLILVEARKMKLLSADDMVEFTGSVEFDSLLTKINISELLFYTNDGNLAIHGTADIDSSSIKFNSSLQAQQLSLSEFANKFTETNASVDSIQNSLLNASVIIQGDINTTSDISGSFQLQQTDITYIDQIVDTIAITNLNLDVDAFHYKMSDTFNIRDISQFDGNVKIAGIDTKYFEDSSTTIAIHKEQQDISLDIRSTNSIAQKTDGILLQMDVSETVPKFSFDYQLNDVQLGSFLADSIIQGNINFQLHLESKGTSSNQIISEAIGSAAVEGRNIRITGFDLDEILANYKKSQNFRLTDVGAYMLVGPLGPLVTKGHDFAKLAKINPDDSTIIRQLYSKWEIDNQILKTKDVAFTTDLTRIAFDGSINLSDLTIPGFTVAVVDARGCSLMDQTISGSFSDPELGELNVVGTLFGAVINIFKVAASNECTPVYEGLVVHPPKK